LQEKALGTYLLHSQNVKVVLADLD
jgi:hypothetical protein